MTILLGLVITLVCMLGGFMAMGGHVEVIWQPWEYVIICGSAAGTFVVANPVKTIKDSGTAMMEAFGQGASGISNGRIRRLASRALSDLAKTQQQRSSRSVRDELDRYFVDLLGFYRDVMVLQLGAGSALINADVRPAVEQAATTDDSVMTMRRIEALSAARAQLEGNVPPALVCESLMVQLLHPVTRSNLSLRPG